MNTSLLDHFVINIDGVLLPWATHSASSRLNVAKECFSANMCYFNLCKNKVIITGLRVINKSG